MQILILDTDDLFRESLSRILREAGHSVTTISQDNLEAMSHCCPDGSDLLFLDIPSQPDILGRIKEYNPELLVVVMSLNPSIESAISALRQGAFDFLVKPFVDSEPLMQALVRARRAIEAASLKRVYLKRILKTFSELSFANEKIRERGYGDGTTELYYNQYFEDILDIELARSRRCDLEFSVLSVKLNYIQEYMAPETNAEFRSQVESIAGCLRQRLRRTDVLARTAVDEFMVILPETTKDGGSIVVDNLRREIAAIVPSKNIMGCQPEGNLPFAIGTATYPLDGMDSPDLIGRARHYA